MGLNRLATAYAVISRHFLASSPTSGFSHSSSPLPLSSPPSDLKQVDYGIACDLHHSSPRPELSSISSKTDLEPGIHSRLVQTKYSSLNLQKDNLSKENVLFSIFSPNGRWIKVAAGFLFLFLFLSVVYLGSGWKSSFWALEPSHFTIILDCGSTGTRVHVYEWSHDSRKGQENLPVVVHSVSGESAKIYGHENGLAYLRVQTEPGLDKFLYNESGLRVSIEPLLNWAEKHIPSYAHRKTPVFLLATAGLRKLPISDAKWILDKAWEILVSYPFMCQRSWVRVISGVEEAYYGWVALNYNMDMLGKTHGHKTFGALDLGGSSMEVTFESGEETKGEYAVKLNIGSVEHQLYAYSLPAYGLNDAFEKSVILLHKKLSERSNEELHYSNNQMNLQIKHPCLQAGYRQSYHCSKCYPHQPGSLQNDRRMTRKEISGTEIELVGDSDWAECQALAKSTVNASLWSHSPVATNCEQYPCALKKHHPTPHGSFYALSGFFFVYKFYNLSSVATYHEILEKGEHFCSKTWKDAQKSVVPQPFVEEYCFRAAYVVALLTDGLHLKDEQITVGSGSITWTLGVAFLEATKSLSTDESLGNQHWPIPDIRYIGNFKLDAVTCTIFLFILLLLCIFVVSYIHRFIPQSWPRCHLPLFEPYSANIGAAIKVP